jgi:pimeloyl-ACP methyl ester carboxylesterase
MPRRPSPAPLPPTELPPARTVTVPGHGEMFLRDTAPGGGPGDRPPVLLLHGWVVSADLNWHAAYDALVSAGYRVIAPDHRSHGRGLRAPDRFRLTDCAADAAALLRALDTGPALVVGYSMGGAIAQLMARDHPELVSGLVLGATCQHFQDPGTAKVWKWMGLVGLLIGLAPRTFYRAGLRRNGLPRDRAAWLIGELMRGEAREIAEAGRELGRFDSRPWLAAVDVPAVVLLTGRDTAVSPGKQRELAAAIRALDTVEVPLDHLELTERPETFNPGLLRALAALPATREASAA